MQDLDFKRLQQLIEIASQASSETLKLPLPRRFDLPVVQEYLDTFLGNMEVTIDTFLKDDAPAANIARAVLEETDFGRILRERNISRQAFEQMLLMRRFQLNNAPIFTLRDSLCARLDDMDIGSEVPMQFLRPPYDVVFLEFGQAENRGKSSYKVYAFDEVFTLEGAYISFHEDCDGSILSEAGIETLGIDRKKPLTCMEFAFTGSPYNASKKRQSVLSDMGAYLSLYWTDDDQSVEETLERHFRLLEAREALSPAMMATIRENLGRVAKTLLYLGTGNREMHEENEASRLADRLTTMKNPAKLRKVQRQQERTYDRVLIGPDRGYKPLEESLAHLERRTGVKPHFRRAHWAVRWYGKGRTQRKLVPIGLTLVNAKGFSDEQVNALVKDYEVF